MEDPGQSPIKKSLSSIPIMQEEQVIKATPPPREYAANMPNMIYTGPIRRGEESEEEEKAEAKTTFGSGEVPSILGEREIPDFSFDIYEQADDPELMVKRQACVEVQV